MLSKIAKLLFIFALLSYLFKWLFLWLFETTDSYFYWAFADFLRTGRYFAPHPYYWTVPTTFAAPFYSFFLYIMRFLMPSRTEIGIHLIQNITIITSAFILYKILKSFVSQNIAAIISSLFLILPANVFISSGIMPEPLAILTVAVYCYLSFKIYIERKNQYWKYLVLFSAFSVLVRYNFICFFVLTLILMSLHDLRKLREKLTGKIKKSILLDALFIFAGLSVIFGWILVNYRLTGTVGLSDQAGKNLYNRILGGDKLTPPANQPNWIKLKEMTNNKVDLFQPTYVLEPVIAPNFGYRTASASQFFSSIAIDTLRIHPLEYIRNTIINFLRIHGNGLPYSTDLYTYGWLGRTCRTLDTITICRAPVETKFASGVWNFLVWTSESYYSIFPAIFNLIFLLPAIIFASLQKTNKFMKFLCVSYFLSAVTVVLPEIPVYRYIYPLLPIKVILITYLLHSIKIKIANHNV